MNVKVKPSDIILVFFSLFLDFLFFFGGGSDT